MSSPLRIFQSDFSSTPAVDAKAQAASSFARTLRAYAEKPQLVPALTPRTPQIAEPKSERPKLVGTPLTCGISLKKVAQPEQPSAPEPAEMPVEPKKHPQPLGAVLLSRAWKWLQKNHATEKQLRVAETISLGDKRFVALIDVEGQKFLVGGGASGVSLLTQLGSTQEPAEALQAMATAAERSK
jgi:hypothetical protein